MHAHYAHMRIRVRGGLFLLSRRWQCLRQEVGKATAFPHDPIILEKWAKGPFGRVLGPKGPNVKPFE